LTDDIDTQANVYHRGIRLTCSPRREAVTRASWPSAQPGACLSLLVNMQWWHWPAPA